MTKTKDKKTTLERWQEEEKMKKIFFTVGKFILGLILFWLVLGILGTILVIVPIQSIIDWIIRNIVAISIGTVPSVVVLVIILLSESSSDDSDSSEIKV